MPTYSGIHCLIIIISCDRTTTMILCLFSFATKPIEMIGLLIDDCYKLLGTINKNIMILFNGLRQKIDRLINK